MFEKPHLWLLAEETMPENVTSGWVGPQNEKVEVSLDPPSSSSSSSSSLGVLLIILTKLLPPSSDSGKVPFAGCQKLFTMKIAN